MVPTLCSTQASLLRRFEKAGGFNLPPVTNPEIIAVQREGRAWLKEAARLITTILDSSRRQIEQPNTHQRYTRSSLPPTLADIPSLLRSYDLVHRITNGTPCDDYLRQVRIQTLQHWLKGDHTISRTEVTLMLLHEADRDNRTLDNRYSLFAISVMEEWIDELTLYGRFRGIPPAEAHARLSYLLGAHLHLYLGPREAETKDRWASAYP